MYAIYKLFKSFVSIHINFVGIQSMHYAQCLIERPGAIFALTNGLKQIEKRGCGNAHKIAGGELEIIAIAKERFDHKGEEHLFALAITLQVKFKFVGVF